MTENELDKNIADFCKHIQKVNIGRLEKQEESDDKLVKPLKYIEVGKIKEATQRYYSETRVHKVKLKEINEDRKKSLTEYEKTIQEYLKQHNQNFIEDVSVLDDTVLIELEIDAEITRDSMRVLEEISDEWSITPGENLKIWLKLWVTDQEVEDEADDELGN